MTPRELTNSILQYAIQGKLVEQRTEEGTGEDLFQLIQVKKQALIKAGKIKKEKPLPEIANDEIQFDIPDTWKWVRVASITILNPKNDLNDDLETAFIPMPCVMDGFRNQHTFEIKKWGDIKKGFTHFADGDIGVAKITPCFQNRKSVIFRDLINGHGAGTTELTIIRTIDDTILREYLLWFFKTDYFISNGVKSFTGTAGQQRIHKDYLSNCLLPLPPLEEQKRIAAKLEEILSLIDHYEAVWNKLEEFNKHFPSDMQKSILQLAIQGKLVEHRPEEGTGEELFQQIQAEKQALIKAGKIKSEKPLPEIAEDEIPFDIPDTWRWVRFCDVASFQNGDRSKNYPNKNEYVDSGVAWINTGHITPDGYLNTDTMHFITEEKYLSLSNGHIQPGDLVYCLRGATFGKTARIEPFSKGAIASSLMIIRLHDISLREYVYWYLKSPVAYRELRKYDNGSAQPNLAAKDVAKYLIPLPPLAEQKRIVAKLEEILPLCDRLR